jgi:hypothetical protein
MLAQRRKVVAEESMRKAALEGFARNQVISVKRDLLQSQKRPSTCTRALSLEGFARNQADMAREAVRHHAVQVIYSPKKKSLLYSEFYIGSILGHWHR